MDEALRDAAPAPLELDARAADGHRYQVLARIPSAPRRSLLWLPALGILALVYMYAHYFFASLSAHAAALFVPFLTVAVAVGAPPYFAALTFAFFSSLCVSLTHYGGGPSPVYWGAGYSSIRQWWTVGFAASVVFVIVWMASPGQALVSS